MDRFAARNDRPENEGIGAPGQGRRPETTLRTSNDTAPDQRRRRTAHSCWCGAAKTKARGMCARHYRAWYYRRRVSNDFEQSPKLSVEQRFWSKVDQNGPTMPHMDTPCWIWTGSRNENGYGLFWGNGRTAGAHRVSYKWANGDIPAGMQVDHVCHNRACVNPAHLRLATTKQNAENRSGAQRDSRSGVRGVSFDKRRNHWRADVKHYGKGICVGTFDTLEAAEAAVIAKRLELFKYNTLDRAPEVADMSTPGQLELFAAVS
jgi:hypothetical protein